MRMFCGLVVALLLLGGCSKEAPDQVALAEPKLSRQYRKDSVTVIVSLSETVITTSEKIRLMIDVHSSPDTEVVFPELGHDIKPFSVEDSYTEPIQTLENGKHLYRRVWTLVPQLPGTITFQPLDLNAGGTVITTEPVEIQVTSLLPVGLDSLEIKDIAESALLLPQQKEKQQRIYILAGIIGTAAFIILLYKRMRRLPPDTILSAHEEAYLGLENLPKEELPRIHALSEILIIFIGRRFRFSSREKTVAEILPLLPGKKLLGRRAPLEKFLTAGEQIRFSNKVPPGFAVELEDYVRSFIEDMKEHPCD